MASSAQNRFPGERINRVSLVAVVADGAGDAGVLTTFVRIIGAGWTDSLLVGAFRAISSLSAPVTICTFGGVRRRTTCAVEAAGTLACAGRLRQTRLVTVVSSIACLASAGV